MIESKDISSTNESYIKYAAAAVLSLFVTAIYWYYMLDPNFRYSIFSLPFSSVMIYVMSLLLFIFTFLIFWLIIKKIPARFKLFSNQNKILCLSSFCVVLLAFCVMCYFLYVNEMVNHPGPEMAGLLFWHTIPTPIIFIITVLLFMLFLYTTNIHISSIDKPTNSNKIYILLCSILAIAVGYQQFSPHIFTDYQNSLHAHAYYVSAYNATFGVPFSLEVTSIYGHYGILFSIPMRIFRALGGTDLLLIFNILISLGSVFVLLAFAYVIHITIKNNTIKYLTVICVICINLWISRYWQIMPHRQIPIAAMAAFIAFYFKHKNLKLFIIAGLPLSSLLLVWSTDNGLVAVLAWVSFIAMQSLQTHSFKSKKLWRNLFVCAGVFVAAIFMAVGFVNLYNVTHGGALLDIRAFFLATGSSQFVNFLQMLPPRKLSAWMLVLAMSLCFIAKALINIRLFNSNRNNSYIYSAYFSFAVLALGGMTYYMNRASWGHHEGAYMVYFVMLALLAQHWLPSVKQFFSNFKEGAVNILCSIKGAMGIGTLFILFTITIGSITNYSYTLMSQNNNRDMWSRNAVVAHIVESFPYIVQGNVTAWGFGAVELYSMLGLDTQIYTTDMANYAITQESIRHLDTTIRENVGRPFITTNASLDYVTESNPDLLTWIYDNYIYIDSAPIYSMYGFHFLYFEPITREN
ncbi:MAG: hypothetical protein FWD38_00840 [Oscillospiraceae bacterium]|nr:hypothetical protein [Oscillospiraceae bacterium]